MTLQIYITIPDYAAAARGAAAIGQSIPEALVRPALPEHAASSPSASSAESTPSMGLFADTDDAAIDIPVLLNNQ